jgi:hypothetical protein
VTLPQLAIPALVTEFTNWFALHVWVTPLFRLTLIVVVAPLTVVVAPVPAVI